MLLYRGALSHDDLIAFTRAVVEKISYRKRKIKININLFLLTNIKIHQQMFLHIFYEAMKGGKGKTIFVGGKMQQIYKTYDGSFEQEF